MIICPNQCLQTLSSRGLVSLECERCHRIFTKSKNQVLAILKTKTTEGRFCSHDCFDKFRKNNSPVPCGNCEKEIYRSLKELKKSKSGKLFCSQSCAATYSNTHKTKGTRRSKVEVWVEQQLTATFLKLLILYNDKTAITSELDVYVPSLNLAFELNGIHHKKPIYGKNKLLQIKANDHKKLMLCKKKRIMLIRIDVSKQNKFSPETSMVYLNTIISAIFLTAESQFYFCI